MTGIHSLNFPPIFPLDSSESVSSGLSVVPESGVCTDKGTTMLPLDDFSLDATHQVGTPEIINNSSNEVSAILVESGSSESVLGFELAPPDLKMFPSIVEGTSPSPVPQKKRIDMLEFPTLFAIEEPIIPVENPKKEESVLVNSKASHSPNSLAKNGEKHSREINNETFVREKSLQNVYSSLEFGNARKYLKDIQDLHARSAQLFDETIYSGDMDTQIVEMKKQISKAASILFYLIEATGTCFDYEKLWEYKREKYIKHAKRNIDNILEKAKNSLFGKDLEEQVYNDFLRRMHIRKEDNLDDLERYMNTEDRAFIVGMVYDITGVVKKPSFNEKQKEELEFIFGFYNQRYTELKNRLDILRQQKIRENIEENITESEVHFGLVGNPPEVPVNVTTKLHIAPQNHRKRLQEKREEKMQE